MLCEVYAVVHALLYVVSFSVLVHKPWEDHTSAKYELIAADMAARGHAVTAIKCRTRASTLCKPEILSQSKLSAVDSLEHHEKCMELLRKICEFMSLVPVPSDLGRRTSMRAATRQGKDEPDAEAVSTVPGILFG